MKTKTTLISAIIGVTVGILLTFTYLRVFENQHPVVESNLNSDSADKVLYWVAPMDANFQRDKPGKSPMGMDLVPVYASEQSSDSPGTITISANVVNNLGVRTAKAQMMSVNDPVVALGIIAYNQDTLVHIHPRVEGWIESLYVKAQGEYVEKGEPLYALYSPELVNAQEEYLLALTQAHKALGDAAKARLSALQMPAQAIAELAKTRKVQQRVVFYAPQSGFIDNLEIREGFYVSPANTLMAIGALQEVWVNTEIMARQASKVRVDMPVSVSLEYLPEEIFSGKIDYIYPTLDTSNRTVRARVRVANPDYLLKPNMYAKVNIDTSNLNGMQEQLVVPKSAVIRTGSQNRVVLALGEGKFKSIQVTLGEIFADYIAISSGLNEFDDVVVSAQFLLDSESSVSSDFKRLDAGDLSEVKQKSMHSMGAPTMQSTNMESAGMDMTTSVWTHALIVDLMPDERKITLDHGELVEWGMSAMTMDFMLDSSIDMSVLQQDMEIHVEIIKTDMPMFTVKTIHIMPMDAAPKTHEGHAQ